MFLDILCYLKDQHNTYEAAILHPINICLPDHFLAHEI